MIPNLWWFLKYVIRKKAIISMQNIFSYFCLVILNVKYNWDIVLKDFIRLSQLPYVFWRASMKFWWLHIITATIYEEINAKKSSDSWISLLPIFILSHQVLIQYFNPSVIRCILLRWARLLGFAIVYGTVILKLYR